MPNPYAPRTQRATAPSFPEGRFRRIGMTDDEVADARARWDELTAAEASAAAESIAGLTDDELLADLVEQRETDALEGLAAWAAGAVAAGSFPSTDVALDALDAYAALTDDERRALTPAVGERPDDAEPGEQISGETADGEVLLPVAEVAPGGPGEAGEVPPDGTPEGGTDPSAAAEVVADARQRIADGTPPSRLLRWMGTDRTRAAALLVAEGERDQPRTAVVSGAKQVLNP